MSHRNIRKMFLVDVCPVQDFFILLHIKRMKVLFSRSVLKVSFHKHFEKGNDTSTRNIAAQHYPCKSVKSVVNKKSVKSVSSV